jgi:hypothetical protein
VRIVDLYWASLSGQNPAMTLNTILTFKRQSPVIRVPGGGTTAHLLNPCSA